MKQALPESQRIKRIAFCLIPIPSSPFVGRKATLYSGNSALWAQSAATLWEHVPVVTSLVLRSGDPRCDHRWAGMNPREAKGKKRKGRPLIHWYSLRQRTALWEQDFMLMLLVCTVTMAQHGLLQLTDLTECFEMFWTVSWDCVWGFVRLRPAVECHQLARFPNCSLSMDKPASHVFAIRNINHPTSGTHIFSFIICWDAMLQRSAMAPKGSQFQDLRTLDYLTKKIPFEWVRLWDPWMFLHSNRFAGGLLNLPLFEWSRLTTIRKTWMMFPAQDFFS